MDLRFALAEKSSAQFFSVCLWPAGRRREWVAWTAPRRC